MFGVSNGVLNNSRNFLTPEKNSYTSVDVQQQRASFYEEVMKWEKAGTGEARASFVSRIMDAYDKGANANVGDEVALNLSHSIFTECPPFPTNLTHLNLSYSNLPNFPEGLPATLLVLKLNQSKQITVLPEDLASSLPHLTELHITNMPLEKLSARCPPSLTVLDISFTEMEALPENLPTSLKELWMSGCMKLIYDPVTLLGQLPDLEKFVAKDGASDPLSFFTKTEQLSKELHAKSALLGAIYEQTYPRSCAAASLLVIAHELGVEKNPPCFIPDSEAHGNNPLELTARCEAAIYRVTSAFEEDDSKLVNARGSLPPNIILAARRLGLTETFYVPHNHHTQAMRSDPDYPNVQTMLEKEGIAFHEEIAPDLSSDALEMRFLTQVDKNGTRLPGAWDDMNHCIAVRPDGSCMDPAFGMNFNSVAEVLAYVASKNVFYEDSGMVIQFKHASAFDR